jgi:hypothetical protein
MKILENILEEIKALREQLSDTDASISAPAAARFVGIGLKTFNRFIDADVGPKFSQMPDGRRFTKRDLIRWREERFAAQQLRKVA